MAKRKRSRRKAVYKPVVSTQAARARSQAARANAATASHAERNEPTRVSFAEEYHYVVTDLRNMGLLAAAMFALLAILAIIFS
jgi:hypothetical protein